jgi:hypothetical protein
VVVDEKFFQLSDEFLTYLADVTNVAKTVVGSFDRHNTIIANFFFLVALLPFDDANCWLLSPCCCWVRQLQAGVVTLCKSSRPFRTRAPAAPPPGLGRALAGFHVASADFPLHRANSPLLPGWRTRHHTRQAIATGSTPDVALRESLGAIGFGRNLRFCAEPFKVRVGLSFRLIGIFADLRNCWVLPCRLNINNKAHAVGRPNNPPVREGRSNKNSYNESGAD